MTDSRIKDQEGIIGFWHPLKKYTINFSILNSFDSQITGIIENDIDEDFKKEGLKVVFSGRIYKNQGTPKAVMGGQDVFWLNLDKIYERQ